MNKIFKYLVNKSYRRKFNEEYSREISDKINLEQDMNAGIYYSTLRSYGSKN